MKIQIENGHVKVVRDEVEGPIEFDDLILNAAMDHECKDLKFLLVAIKQAEADILREIVQGEYLTRNDV